MVRSETVIDKQIAYQGQRLNDALSGVVLVGDVVPSQKAERFLPLIESLVFLVW
jgi:hypothetical protein